MNQDKQPKVETKETFYTSNDVNFSKDVNFDSNSANVDSNPIKKPKKEVNRGLIITIISSVVLIGLVSLFSILLYNSSISTGTTDGVNILNFILLGFGILFTVIGLISLVIFVSSMFKYMTTKRDDTNNKKKYFRRLITSLVVMFLSSLLAGGLLVFSAKEFGQIQEVESGIITTPDVVLGLSAPVSITFDATQVAVDRINNNVVSYRWDFGDGQVATGPVVTHEYRLKPESGFYEVVLRVNLQAKNDPQAPVTGVEFRKVIGIENQRVTPVIQADVVRGRAPLTVNFNATNSIDLDGRIVNYEWDFNGDEIVDDNGEVSSFTYEEPGTYDVNLYLVDSNGASETTSIEIEVLSQDIVQGVITNDPEDEILTPEKTYTFDASQSVSDEGVIQTYTWDFGDGQVRTGQRVTYSFEEEGLYTVKLNLEDSSGNIGVLEQEFIVSNSPSGLFAKIQTNPSLAQGQTALVGTAPFKVEFDASTSSAFGSNIVDYAWDFDGDGTVDDNGQEVEYTFTNPGEFAVSLNITSAEGKTANKLFNVVATGTGIRPVVTATPIVGQVPLTVNFDATATQEASSSNIVSFRWDFGDGTPLRRGLPVMTHRFDRVGDFKVTVTAVTDTNEIASTEVMIFVNPVPLQACFDSSRDSGTDRVIVSFDPSCTTGPATRFNWDFGDGNTSVERRPVHTFVGMGEYTVKLEVSSNDNDISVFEKVIVVE